MASSLLGRRQSSTTSLSKYYHETPDPDQSSLDFCNSFWGLNDVGVEVLLARMRGAARTMDELRGFWKERIAIEEDYAKRLGKLAKLPIGRDEIGDLRMALDNLRMETEKQSNAHLNFVQEMRREIETPVADFITKQNNHKKTFQVTIEKSFKSKQTQERYVEKAREKYETDCVHINSYTAQSTILQGKELEKISYKLDRANQTVEANARDYQNFARALSDTARRWEGEWKTYCDQCQDLEDERIEFIKDNVWAFANAVSTVCVADDESCERVREVLEQVEPDKEMESFVREYGTGPVMTEPTPFISYKQSGPPTGPKTKQANFLRSSLRAPAQRPQPPAQPQPAPVPQQLRDEPIGPGNAGIGAIGGGSGSIPPKIGPNGVTSAPIPTSTSAKPPSTASSLPSSSAPSTYQPKSTPSTTTSLPASSSGGRQPPGEQTMLSIGGNAYPVDPNADPQGKPMVKPRAGSSNVGDDKDPIAQALEALRKGGPGGPGGSVNRTRSTAGPRPGITPAGTSSGGPPKPAINNPAPPASVQSPPKSRLSMDYHEAASSVVGGPPMSTSRPTSPSIHAAHMQPPQTTVHPSEMHQQALPGERRLSINRGQPPNAAAGSNVRRSPSPAREGFVGIGAQGRSTSPQPFNGPSSRSASPNIPQYGQQPPSNRPANTNTGGEYGAPRTTSPSGFGIVLDASGRVAHDSMAEEFSRRNPAGGPGTGPAGYGGPGQMQRPPSQAGGLPGYGGAPQQPGGYQQPPQQPGYAQSQQMYGHGAPPNQQTPQMTGGYGAQQPQGYGAPPPAQSPALNGYQPGGGPNGMPASQSYPPNQYPGQAAPGYGAGGYQQQQQAGHGMRSPSPAVPPTPAPAPAPAPAPPATPAGGPSSSGAQQQQFADDGSGILFYVKALYDYTATIPEEFDFQAGDIIAVTATPEDGWWS
ncbi:hypothetical protein FRC02_000696, partial [Tulasnella sp. 418]